MDKYFKQSERFGFSGIDNGGALFIPTTTELFRACPRQVLSVPKFCDAMNEHDYEYTPCAIRPSSSYTICVPVVESSSEKGSTPPSATLGDLSHA